MRRCGVNALSAIISARKLTQTEFARRVGVHPSVSNHWVNGTRLIPVYRLDAVADVLGVTVEDLAAPKPRRRVRIVRHPLPPLTWAYVQKCQLCGREGAEQRLTRERVQQVALAGPSRCGVCGGWLALECQDAGSIGSASASEPIRYAPRSSVPRRRAS